MAPAWLSARQTRYTGYASVYILVVLAVLVVVNFLANRYDKSYDSTANKQFSLSDQTIKVVKDLKRDVQINYFGAQNEFRRPGPVAAPEGDPPHVHRRHGLVALTVVPRAPNFSALRRVSSKADRA